jgi:hypothetical protein
MRERRNERYNEKGNVRVRIWGTMQFEQPMIGESENMGDNAVRAAHDHATLGESENMGDNAVRASHATLDNKQ